MERENLLIGGSSPIENWEALLWLGHVVSTPSRTWRPGHQSLTLLRYTCLPNAYKTPS